MRIISMAYGLFAYLLGVGSLVLFILFANNHIGVVLPQYASLGIDHANGAPFSNPLLVNLSLIALFGFQHSVMARPGFKKILNQMIPAGLERSSYVLMTAVVTLLLVQHWQPMAGSVWAVENHAGRLALTSLYYVGWMITFLATYLINHFHLFGLQQSFHPNDPDAGAKTFVTPFFYKLVRHPIQSGIFIAMLATPDMTMGRAVLASGMIVYIFIGLMFEERDLIAEFGDTYRDYKKRVPALLPWFKRGN